MTDLTQRLAAVHSEHCALPNGMGYTCRCRQRFDRRSDHAVHVAAIQAEVLLEEFDILSKDQEQYAICEWDEHYAEPSRGSYIGAWVPVQKQAGQL